MPNDELMTIRQVAEELGVSQETIRKTIKAGRLRYSQPTGAYGSIRIRRSWFNAWVDNAASTLSPQLQAEAKERCKERGAGGQSGRK